MGATKAMANTDSLAQYHLPCGKSSEDWLNAQSITSCLRFLQEQAERIGLPLTAHLISTAALAALDEAMPVGNAPVN